MESMAKNIVVELNGEKKFDVYLELFDGTKSPIVATFAFRKDALIFAKNRMDESGIEIIVHDEIEGNEYIVDGMHIDEIIQKNLTQG